MPVEGRRTVAVCRQCTSALAVRVLADGTVRPIGTGRNCSCGGDSFEVVGDLETDSGDEPGGPTDDDGEYPKV